MKLLILIAGFATLSCSSSKKTSAELTDNSGQAPSAVVAKANIDSIPVCIQQMIDIFKKDALQNPPRKIYSYTYKGKTVYYVQPICCDFFSELYDDKCVLMAHPDGGFTGRGDGKLPDFATEKTNEKLVWEDKREAGKRK